MRLDRLLGILTVLLQHARVTAPMLAERFEVTRRTIGRDIDILCQAGIPIITQQGIGGGISIAEGFKLDKSVLTTDELSSIVAALKGIRSVSEESQIERTLDKFHAGAGSVMSLSEPVVINLASHYKAQLTEKITLIKRAIREGRLIAFDYFYEKGESRRRVEPNYVLFQWAAWYVVGFCRERQDFRMFKLTRLWNLTLCDERYTLREIPPEKQDADAYFMKEDTTLLALFTPSEKFKLIDAFGPDCFTETTEGLRLELAVANSSYWTDWLLGFGGKVRVLEPPEFIEILQEAANSILERYKDGRE